MNEQVETTGPPEQNETSSLPTVDLTELETKLNDLVEVLQADQEQKQLEAENLAIEAEKLAKEEAEAELLAAEQAKEQAKVDAKNQKLAEEQQKTDTENIEDFRANVLNELKMLNENVRHYEEVGQAIIEHQKVEMELYNAVYFASIAVILVVCIMPSVWIAKQFKNMLKSFIY